MPDTRRPPVFKKSSARKAATLGSGLGKTWSSVILRIFSQSRLEKVRFGGHDDAMELRLASAPDAGTPPTADELELLEKAREDFRAGRFTVDPATARARPAAAAAELGSRLLAEG